jgi:hypothetical protein
MTDNSKKPRARVAVLAAGVAAAATAVLSGCTTTPTVTSQAPTAKLVPTAGSSVPSVQLTQQGANRIGLETAVVTLGQGGEATFPYTALLYESNGQAAVYVTSGPLTFTRHFVNVDTINGQVVTVKSGVTPGDRVATDGSEELLGVQNGVGVET